MNEKAYKAMGLAGAAGDCGRNCSHGNRNRRRCDLHYKRCPFTEKKRKESYSNTEETQEVVGRWIQEKRKRIRILGKILFILYVIFIVYFLLFSDWYGRTGEMREYHYNLVLFKEIKKILAVS